MKPTVAPWAAFAGHVDRILTRRAHESLAFFPALLASARDAVVVLPHIPVTVYFPLYGTASSWVNCKSNENK